MSEAETTTSTYRVIRFEREYNNRALLHDIERGVNVSVQAEDYGSDKPDDFDDRLNELVAGNKIEARVIGDPEERNSWQFEAFEVLSDETLFLQNVGQKGQLSAPVDDIWQSRDEERDLGWDNLTVSETGEVRAEVQLFLEQRNDLDMWRAMLEGRFDFEPWYSGEMLFSLEIGVQDLILVNPADAEYIILFAFPAESPALEDIAQEVEQASVEGEAI